jgi:hypothetical protein
MAVTLSLVPLLTAAVTSCCAAALAVSAPGPAPLRLCHGPTRNVNTHSHRLTYC